MRADQQLRASLKEIDDLKATLDEHAITERKQAEESVRQSEARYRTLFDTLIEGFCIIEMIFDSDGKPVDYRFLEINPAFEKQTGLHKAQGKLMRDLAPNHETHWFGIYGKIAVTGETMRFENEAKALGRYYDVCAYRVGGPESRKVAILFNDITERKRAEAEAAQLADIVQSADDAIIGKDMNSIVTSWNKGAEHIFGYKAREMVGTSIMQIIPAERRDEEKRLLEKIKRGESVEQYETLRQTKDGRLINVSVTLSPIKDNTRRIFGVSKVARDITKRKLMEKELHQLNTQLEQRVAERTAELERANHELRDALENVKTLSGLLPICADCKKVRDDKGYWNQIETYITKHSDASFSHGLCPECSIKFLENGGLPVPDKLRKATEN